MFPEDAALEPGEVCYAMNIESDDIEMSDTVTAVGNIEQGDKKGMSNIRIQKISITKLHTDAIVNAANEGLWEGGGVCGAIFREAGSKDLRKACEAIGGCRTGSAVITPGFALPAK